MTLGTVLQRTKLLCKIHLLLCFTKRILLLYCGRAVKELCSLLKPSAIETHLKTA